MKIFYLIVIGLIFIEPIYGQIDKNGSPISITEELKNYEFEDFTLIVEYYPIKDNIDNKKSSLYFYESPTNDNYLFWAQNMFSYQFTVKKEGNIYLNVTLNQKNREGERKFFYNISNPRNGYYKTIPCTIKGDITELRANELVINQYDKVSKIYTKDSVKYCTFNETELIIQPFLNIENEVLNIIQKYKLRNENNIEINDTIEYIKNETIGGRLDFEKFMIGYGSTDAEYKIHLYSLKMWGYAVKEFGLKNYKKAIDLWIEIHNTKLTEDEITALKNGFDEE
jgi:hypothetical protein